MDNTDLGSVLGSVAAYNSGSAVIAVLTALTSLLLWDRKRMQTVIDAQTEQLGRVADALGEVRIALAELTGAVDALKHLAGS